MGKITKISWCDHTFSPWWGCTQVSPGCTNCYAERDSKRWGLDIWGASAPRRFFGDKHWDEPLAWNRAAERDGVLRRVFCGSMCDVFEDRPDLGDHRLRLYRLIEQTPALNWLLLTKRPENVMDFVPELYKHGGWPVNAWIGTTAENQEMADQRIPELIKIPAAIRFVSCEPLLGAIDLLGRTVNQVWINDIGDFDNMECGVGWVIVGGESGPNARPMQEAWARSLRDQCQASDVPFFFKQFGEYVSLPQARELGVKLSIVDAMNANSLGGGFVRVGKKLAGDLLDGQAWHEFPGQI